MSDADNKQTSDAEIEEEKVQVNENDNEQSEMAVKKRSGEQSSSDSHATENAMSDTSLQTQSKNKRPKIESHTENSEKEESNDNKPSESTNNVKRLKSTESSDTDDSVESKPALLEQELIVEGKRKRTSVNRLLLLAEPKKEAFHVPKGRGKVLDTIPWVNQCINTCSSDDLKLLHRVLFNRAGSAREIKKNIRLFNGFAFNKGDDEYNRVRDKISSPKFTMSNLRFFCKVLGLDKSGTKEQVVERVMEFLLKPCNTGKKVIKKHKRSAKSKARARAATKRTKTTTASKRKKKKKLRESDDEVDRESIKSDDSDVSGDGDNEDSDVEMKKPRAPPGKKRAPRKTQKSQLTEPLVSSSSEDDKKTVEEDTLHASASEDEEKKQTCEHEDTSATADVGETMEKPENSTKAKMPPSDDDLRECTKKLLQGVNFEEVTVKSVIAQVFKEFPDFNLVNRKPFIKELIIEAYGTNR